MTLAARAASRPVYAQGAMGARAMRAWEGEPEVRGGLATRTGLTTEAVCGTSDI
jgi:hypothetical protein